MRAFGASSHHYCSNLSKARLLYHILLYLFCASALVALQLFLTPSSYVCHHICSNSRFNSLQVYKS